MDINKVIQDIYNTGLIIKAEAEGPARAEAQEAFARARARALVSAMYNGGYSDVHKQGRGPMVRPNGYTFATGYDVEEALIAGLAEAIYKILRQV